MAVPSEDVTPASTATATTCKNSQNHLHNFKNLQSISRKQLSMIVIHGFKISYFMVVILLNDAGCDAKQVSMATVSINLMA